MTNKIDSILKNIVNNKLTKEEVYTLYSILQRQYIDAVAKETVINNRIGADYVRALAQETVQNYIKTLAMQQEARKRTKRGLKV